METNKKLVIGLFGFGVVGEGLYKVLSQTPSLDARIKKICIKNYGKKRNAPATLFTTDKDEILDDREINVIVEVIDDAEGIRNIHSSDTARTGGNRGLRGLKGLRGFNVLNVLNLLNLLNLINYFC